MGASKSLSSLKTILGLLSPILFLSFFFGNTTMGATNTVAIAINCGGPQYTDPSGVVYRADQFFSGGLTYKTNSAIAGTEDDVLYQTERWGTFSYRIPLANGNYLLTLKFAEIYEYARWAGARVFHVKAQGQKVITDLDLYRKAGQYKAYDVTLPVMVNNGFLNVEFYNERNNAKVNAILIAQEGSVVPEKGKVKGRVIDASSKFPIPQATVTVIDSSNTPKSSPTNDDGRYEIGEIIAGDIRGAMTKEGYTPYSFQRTLLAGETKVVDGELSPILPEIKNVEAKDITTNSARITWETDQQADSLVEYGETPSNGESEPDSTLTKIHQVPLKNLKPGTEYHYKVTSRNKYGFPSSSEDKTFTTQALSSPIEVKITYPANGASISNSATRVEGTVANKLGYETGVVVNGVLAVVRGEQFLANQIQLTETDNSIVAAATDVKGNQKEDKVDVKAFQSGNYIKITTNKEWGLSPLEAVLTLDSSLDLAIAEITYIGPGQVEWLEKAENEYKIRIAVEGAYVFTASVTDGSGIRYVDTLGIMVLSKAELESLLAGKWEGMKGALVSGNMEAALDYFAYGSRDRYRQLFMELGGEKIQSIFSNIMEMQLYSVSGNFAKCGALRRESGGIYSYPVTFVQDGKGIWKIMGF